MGKQSPRRHPPDALIHAYVAGELDPALRAAITQHLGRCAECRRTEQRVEGLKSLIAERTPQGFDDLKWRRISQGVMSQLEDDALESHHLFGHGSRAQWTIAALAAAAALALLVWFAPRPPKQKPVPQVAVAREEVKAPTITSGDTPFDLQLPQGLQLHLSEGARLLARSTVPTEIDLELQLGQLDVRALAPLDPTIPIRVRTPDFVALARSTDFSVGYQSTESFVAVRDGEVELLPGNKVVKKGESNVFRHVRKPIALGEQHREKIAVRKKERAQAIEEETPEDVHEEEETAPETDEPGGPKEIEPAAVPSGDEAPKKSSSEGVTSVRVIPPPEDAWTQKLRQAEEAYSARDYEKAILFAEDIIANAGMRGEVPLAKQMLCDLFVAAKRPDRAITACSALLANATEEESRVTHQKLATIYRRDLNDCKSAIEHYTRAIVFGRASPFDEESLIWRARCEIQLGQLAAARSDVSALEQRAAGLVRPEELQDLKKRLMQIQPR